jgi:cell division protein FtsB
LIQRQWDQQEAEIKALEAEIEALKKEPQFVENN